MPLLLLDSWDPTARLEAIHPNLNPAGWTLSTLTLAWAARPSQNGPRSTVMVSMYPEDSSRALKGYQEHQQVGRVAHQAPAFEIEGTIISRLRRPIRPEPSRYRSAQRALWYREGGECWHVRPRMIYVPWTK